MGTRKLARERYVRGNDRIRTGGKRGRRGIYEAEADAVDHENVYTL